MNKSAAAFVKGDFKTGWDEHAKFAREPVKDYKNATTIQTAPAQESAQSEVNSAAQLEQLKKKLRY